jgi:hypothetical protein
MGRIEIARIAKRIDRGVTVVFGGAATTSGTIFWSIFRRLISSSG